MNGTFFDGLDELYHHARFEEDRPTRAGCRCENVVCFFTGRMSRSGKPPVLNLLKRPKIRFFALQGRLVGPIHVKLGRANGHLGTLGSVKFHFNRLRECGPKYQKFPVFGKKSPHRGDSLDRFRNFF